jgi:hypothetical protein
MKTCLGAISALLVLAPGQTAFAQGDRCRDVLALGVQEQFSLSSSQSLETSMFELVCSERSRSGSSSSGFRFELPIPELAGFLGMGANSANTSQRRSAWCSNQNRHTDSDSALNLARSVVNNEAVRAWQSCMSNQGLSCSSEALDDQRFRIEVTWRINAHANDPVITSEIRTTGARCPSMLVLRRGAHIPSYDRIVEVCEREGDGIAMVDFATTQGHVSCELPARRPRPTFSESVRSCLDGDPQGCVEMRLLGMQARESCITAIEAPHRGLVNDQQSAAEAQARAIAERQCGNIEGNVRATEGLIENARRSCQNGRAAACGRARTAALTVASSAATEIARALAGQPPEHARGR